MLNKYLFLRNHIHLRVLLSCALFLLAILPNASYADAACPGCLALDELNFDRTLARFPYALVKFDVAFPFGEKHEAFAEFSKLAHKLTDELLIGSVGIKDYGELENKALGERFGITQKDLPSVLLFKDGNTRSAYARFPAERVLNLDNLQSFVTAHTQLYFAREGCLKDYNEAVGDYLSLTDAARREVLERLKALRADLRESQKWSADVYLTFMQKINEKGNQFVANELKRLERVLRGKLSETQLAKMQKKLNILEAFKQPKVEAERKNQNEL